MPARGLPRDRDLPVNYDASSVEVLEGLEPVRRRPGMYVGGTDEGALHHLATELVDNAMDEIIAGHARHISVALASDGCLTVADDGRGIPVEPHPKFPDRSTLEVIFCTLHAGAKFSGDAYQTAGGLHGVGASVVNALSQKLRVEVVRDGSRYTQEFVRGEPLGPVASLGPAGRSRGTRVTFLPDSEIFGGQMLLPARLFAATRSRAFLFPGVHISWQSEVDDGTTPTKADFHFPGGLSDRLSERLGPALSEDPPQFSGTVEFETRFNIPGRVEWALAWVEAHDGFVQSYCNTIPTPQGGSHVAGFWSAIMKGVRGYGALAGNRRIALITREDLMVGGCLLLSCFIRNPEFTGQTKERLATADAQRLVEGAVRDHFENWLAGDPKVSGRILDIVLRNAEERLRRKQEREATRKTATQRLRLPGKLVDCTNNARSGSELFIVEGDSAGGSAKMARNRANQALLPLRGKILNVLSATPARLESNSEIADLSLALGTGLGTACKVDDLRYEKIIIMTDADVDGAHIASLLMTFFFTQMLPVIEGGHLYLACPPLFRLTQGARRVYCLDEVERDTWLKRGLGGSGKVDIARFKGLGEMDAKDLKETTMDPGTRRLIRVTIDDDRPGATSELVDRLMGKRPETRFAYIQENAGLSNALDV